MYLSMSVPMYVWGGIYLKAHEAVGRERRHILKRHVNFLLQRGVAGIVDNSKDILEVSTSILRITFHLYIHPPPHTHTRSKRK